MHGTCDPVFHVPKLHRHADRNASVQGVQLQLVCIACLFALKFSNPLCTRPQLLPYSRNFKHKHNTTQKRKRKHHQWEQKKKYTSVDPKEHEMVFFSAIWLHLQNSAVDVWNSWPQKIHSITHQQHCKRHAPHLPTSAIDRPKATLWPTPIQWHPQPHSPCHTRDPTTPCNGTLCDTFSQHLPPSRSDTIRRPWHRPRCSCHIVI